MGDKSPGNVMQKRYVVIILATMAIVGVAVFQSLAGLHQEVANAEKALQKHVLHTTDQLASLHQQGVVNTGGVQNVEAKVVSLVEEVSPLKTEAAKVTEEVTTLKKENAKVETLIEEVATLKKEAAKVVSLAEEVATLKSPLSGRD